MLQKLEINIMKKNPIMAITVNPKAIKTYKSKTQNNIEHAENYDRKLPF